MAMATVNNGVNVAGAAGRARSAEGRAARRRSSRGGRPASGRTARTAQATVSGFFGLGEEQTHKTETTFEADHPEIFASEDHGITPIEYVLVGLASCLTAGVAAVAQNRGVQLRSVESKLEGTMDIQGILGMDSDVRNGYDDIKVTFKIDADASKKDIEAIVAQSQKRSAVYDIVTNPMNVTVEVGLDDHRSSHRTSRRSSSGPGTPASRRAGFSPSARSITSCSSAARWRTPGAASAGTRCGC